MHLWPQVNPGSTNKQRREQEGLLSRRLFLKLDLVEVPAKYLDILDFADVSQESTLDKVSEFTSAGATSYDFPDD